MRVNKFPLPSDWYTGFEPRPPSAGEITNVQVRRPEREIAAKSRLTHSPSSGLKILRLGIIEYSSHCDIGLAELAVDIESTIAGWLPIVSMTTRATLVEADTS